jgi:hypothetical protein
MNNLAKNHEWKSLIVKNYIAQAMDKFDQKRKFDQELSEKKYGNFAWKLAPSRVSRLC